MNVRGLLSGVLLAVAITAASVWAGPSATFTETFDGTIDEASWRAGTSDEISADGGNPGFFLHAPQLDAAAPQLVVIGALAPTFLGNYRFMGVVSLGVDIDLFAVGISADKRPVSLVLHGDMGTADTSDDCDAVLVGSKTVPRPGSGWKSFDFKVPAWSGKLPGGWTLLGACAGLPADEAWNRVIVHVSDARFELGEPGFFYFSQVWDLGFDNPRITLGKGGSGPTLAVPVEPID